MGQLGTRGVEVLIAAVDTGSATTNIYARHSSGFPGGASLVPLIQAVAKVCIERGVRAAFILVRALVQVSVNSPRPPVPFARSLQNTHVARALDSLPPVESMLDRSAFKEGPAAADVPSVLGRVGLLGGLASIARLRGNTTAFKFNSATAGSVVSPEPVALVTPAVADAAIALARHAAKDLQGHHDALATALGQAVVALNKAKKPEEYSQPKKIAEVTAARNELETTRATLLARHDAVRDSVTEIVRQLDELAVAWPASPAGGRNIAADVAKKQADALADAARRALTDAQNCDAQLLGLAPTGDGVLTIEQRVLALRDKVAAGDDAPSLLEDINALLLQVRSGSDGGNRTGSGSSGGRSFLARAVTRAAARGDAIRLGSLVPPSLLGPYGNRVASGAPTALLPVDGVPVSVRGFQRFSTNFCWLFSLTHVLTASKDVRRVAGALTAPSFASGADALLSMVASASGAFELTIAQVYAAATAIVRGATSKVDVLQQQSVCDALQWALAGRARNAPGRELRRLLTARRIRSEEVFTTHDPSCAYYDPTGVLPPTFSRVWLPSILRVSGAEFSVVGCEDAAAQQLPASSFGTRIHAGAGEEGVAASESACLSRLASHNLAYLSQPDCNVCAMPLIRYGEERLTVAPPLLAISLQPGQATAVNVPPRIFLTGVGDAASHAAAAAAAPVAHGYRLIGRVQHSGDRTGGHFTALSGDGPGLLQADDARITRAVGALGGTTLGCAFALYEAAPLPPHAGPPPATPVRLSAGDYTAIAQVLLGNDEIALIPATWAKRSPDIVIIIDDSDSDGDAPVQAAQGTQQRTGAGAPAAAATAATGMAVAGQEAAAATVARREAAAAAAARQEAAASAAAAAVAAMVSDGSSAAAAIAAARAAVAPFAMPGGQKRVRAPLSDETSETRSDGLTGDEGGSDVDDPKPEAGFRRARCSHKNGRGLQCKRKKAHRERHSFK